VLESTLPYLDVRLKQLCYFIKHVAFLEVYQLTQDDSYLNKRISFATAINTPNLVAPFVKQLLLVEVCCFGTVELMWKFYRAQSAAKHLKLDRLEKRFKAGGTIMAADSSFIPESNLTPDSLLTFIKFDLRDKNVNAFESFASNIYKQSFEMHYSGLSPVGYYLVEQRCIKEMYQVFMDKFPFIHSVLALTVSSPQSRGNHVGLSPYFGEDNEDGNDDHENNNSDISDVVYLGKYEKLTKKERAILEFFIAQLRL
jgi:hypothetical protein